MKLNIKLRKNNLLVHLKGIPKNPVLGVNLRVVQNPDPPVAAAVKAPIMNLLNTENLQVAETNLKITLVLSNIKLK